LVIVAERFDDLPYRRGWVGLGRLTQALGALRSVMDAGVPASAQIGLSTEFLASLSAILRAP
jgi:hypothetical protein